MMARRVKCLCVLAAIAVATPVTMPSAQERPDFRFHRHDSHWDVFQPERRVGLALYPVQQVIGLPGEARQAVAIVGAAAIRNYTRRTGFEACAMFCRDHDGQRWALEILSARSHRACPVLPLCPAGFVPDSAQTDIHSHGPKSRYRHNVADAWLTGESVATRIATNPAVVRFSAADRSGPPGYLVTPIGLIETPGTGKPLPLNIETPRPDGAKCTHDAQSRASAHAVAPR